MGFYSEKVKELTPYVPGEQPKDGEYIKLNTNENPYSPSPKVEKAIQNFSFEKLKLYPDFECMDLRKTFAESVGVSPENVFVGNGSDEVLAIAFQAFFMNKENVLMPDISYSFYPVYCKMYNVKANEMPLKEDYRINIADYLIDNNGIVIANPNAPTSLALSRNEIEEILKNNLDRVVLIDEAYVDFGAESCVPLLSKYDNLFIVRTLSKSYSLAGMRIGFGIGSKKLIEAMNRIKDSFNSYPIDSLAQVAAKAAIEDKIYFNETINKIINTRSRVIEQLEELGFEVLESKTNFLFISNPKKSAEELFQSLKENKILVRYFKKPRLDNFLRITIGTDEQMDELIKVIKEEVI